MKIPIIPNFCEEFDHDVLALPLLQKPEQVLKEFNSW